jgi:hypothetical protein
MDELLDEIKALRKEILELKQETTELNNRLTTHISFIHNVYETLKFPIYYIARMNSRLSNIFIPTINDQQG